MGLFGFACARCWDYNCNCTSEELEQHKKLNALNKKETTETKVSKTLPEVSSGDIILKDAKQYYIKDIVDGMPIGDKITNVPSEMEFNVKIEEPYKKFIVWE
jgi:hypothetical protein